MKIDFDRWVDEGYRVIPANGKFPYFPALPKNEHNKATWLPFLERAPSEEELSLWRDIKGHTGVCVLTGKGSGIIAIDWDCYNDYPEILKLIPESPVIRVGKSPKWMRIYKYNSALPSEKILLREVDELQDGIELLTDGRYFIADGIHPDTKKPYFYVGDHLLNVNKEQLPEFPFANWLSIKRLAEQYRSNNSNKHHAAEGGRHNSLISLAGKLITQKKPNKEIVEKLIELDESFPASYFKTHKNTPEKMIESVMQTHERKEIHRKDSINNIIGQDESVFYDFTEKGLKPNYKELAEHIKETYNAVTDDSSTYLYKGSHFEGLSNLELESLIYKKTKGVGSPAHIPGFAKFIRANTYEKDFFDVSNQGFLNLTNGFLNVRTREMVPHAPEHRQQLTLQTSYDHRAQCPKWTEFLNQIFINNNDLIELVREMFGYVLLGGEPFLHKAFVLHGSGRNGKSTLIKIMQELIGIGNFSSVSMRDLDKPFSVVLLKNKVVNLTEETPRDTINAECFKAAVGGAYMIASKKGQDEFMLKCQARFIFACNSLPIFKDSSVGLLSRLVMIPFEYEVPESERDPNLTEKLKTEMSGILNWALVGAERFFTMGPQLNYLDATREAKEEYQRESDSVYEFFCEHITLSSDDYTSKSRLWEKYKNWCLEEGVNMPVMQKTLTRKIREYAKTRAIREGLRIDSNSFKENRRGSPAVKVINNIGLKI